jgi:hypothetical protein
LNPKQPGQTTPWQEQLSPEPVAHLSQNHLLPMLLRRAMGERIEGQSSSSSSGSSISGGESVGSTHGSVLWGRSVVGVAQAPPPTAGSSSSSGSIGGSARGDKGGLVVTSATQDGATEQLHCQYLVAADGANSGVR